MEIGKIITIVENFAPLELQEDWDCSGYVIDIKKKDIKKIMLCLTVTTDIIKQALQNNIDLIISHHPLFFIPFEFNKNIPIYCAHTNLDKTNGGTTDSLIEILGFFKAQKIGDFLRLVELKDEILLDDFINTIKSKLNLNRVLLVNNFKKTKIKKLAFCAGSGIEFLSDAEKFGADILITGDVKYHNALDSSIIILDTGHFESEYPILDKIKKLLNNLELEVIKANEKSPFIDY